MKIFRLVAVNATKLVGIRCDRCGSEARLNDHQLGVCAMQEYLCVDFTSGYGARAFDDGTHYSCELCEACVKAVVGSYLRAEDHRWPFGEVECHQAGNPATPHWE